MNTQQNELMRPAAPVIEPLLLIGCRFYAVFFAICLCVLPVCGQSTNFESVALPAVSPQAVTIGPSAQVSVNVKLSSTGPDVIPDSVVLLDVDAKGVPIQPVAILKDDGVGADYVAGDWIYSGTFTLVPGPDSASRLKRLRVSASFEDGSTVLSDIATVELLPSGVPVDVRPSDMSLAVYDTIRSQEVISNEVIVYFQPGTSYSAIASVVASVQGQLVGLFRTEALDFWQVQLPCSSYGCVENAVSLLMADKRAEGAEPDFVVHADGVTPDDKEFGKQWGIGTTSTDKAWAITRGSILPEHKNGVIVAVLDTGVDETHEDFQKNGVSKVKLGKSFVKGADTSADDDPESHGTMVAGIVGAYGNNNKIGIAGICWDCPILAIKTMDKDGKADTENSAAGLREACGKEALVINMSFSNPSVNTVMQKAVEDALEKGRTLVAAAGNSGNQADEYPATYTNVISVGATDVKDKVWEKSNFGENIKIYAPGVKVFSTLRDNKYDKASGTSLAAPHVAGAVALMRAVNPKLDEPSLRRRLEVKADLITVVHPISGKDRVIRRLNTFAPVFEVASTKSEMCPGTQDQSVDGLTITLGPPFSRGKNDKTDASICGYSIPLEKATSYSVKASYTLNTWDAYKKDAYWDSMSISISQKYYWVLNGLMDPIDKLPNLLSVAAVVGGETRGPDSFKVVEGALDDKTKIKGFDTNYLNLVLDTKTGPDSDDQYPSWGKITVQDITPKEP
jgi:thermitase